MPSQKGLAVNFAFGSQSGLTWGAPVTLTGWLLQSANHGVESDLASVRDGDGTTVTDVYYDQRSTAELRFVITSGTISTARAATTLDNVVPGTLLNITACAARPDLIESSWVVTEAGPRIEGDNTGAAMAVLPLRFRSGITATAS